MPCPYSSSKDAAGKSCGGRSAAVRGATSKYDPQRTPAENLHPLAGLNDHLNRLKEQAVRNALTGRPTPGGYKPAGSSGRSRGKRPTVGTPLTGWNLPSRGSNRSRNSGSGRGRRPTVGTPQTGWNLTAGGRRGGGSFESPLGQSRKLKTGYTGYRKTLSITGY